MAPSRGAAPRLRVDVSDERGRSRSPGLGRWLARVAPSRARGVVRVAIVSARTVATLNRTHRGHDHATDVLSFPAAPLPRTPERLLGDIVIAREVARRQAREAGHAERTEHRVLALHGLLHLLGYDHETDRGQMATFERRLRARGGLREGLIERS